MNEKETRAAFVLAIVGWWYWFLGSGSYAAPGNMKVADLKGQGDRRQSPSVRWAGGTALDRSTIGFASL